MIGRRDLTVQQREWNARWGAPFGYPAFRRQLVARIGRRVRSFALEARAVGPFGFQGDNNATRIFEYTWAFNATDVVPGMSVVDVGGSHGGLQFVLANAGARVINVDPGSKAEMGWPVSGESIAKLNTVFKTNVELRPRYLDEAGIPEASVDRVYCISTIEHVPPDRLDNLIDEIYRILKIGGLAVLTVDLFFDLFPFTDRMFNLHGRNVNIAELVQRSRLNLVQGNVAELFGYEEFNVRDVQAMLNDCALGNIAPNVPQAFVLQKT